MTPSKRESGLQTPFDAVIFDLDGVITDTASLHAEAWRDVLNGVMADPRAGPAALRPFDIEEDYRRHIDGRRREDGVEAFLRSRGLEMPVGTPDDPPDAWTVHGVAARKNARFLELLPIRGIRVLPGARALLDRLRLAHVPVGLVSSSRNTPAVLREAGIASSFAVVLDGNEQARRGLPGKPDPAAYLAAADAMGVDPRRAAVVEDAVAGVRAARRGGFGLVVAIGPPAARRELEEAGADFVLDNVGELDLGESRDDPWLLVYEGFDPIHESHREALTVLGNGYLATRGAMPEHRADGIHYPGTYLAGVLNRLVSTIEGEDRVDESLVNVPNWLPLDVCFGDGLWWSEGGLAEESSRRVLDLRRGLLTRSVTLVHRSGRAVLVRQRRLVSMDRPHIAVLETELVPQGWSGRISVRSSVDPEVENTNAVESPLLATRHLVPLGVEHLGDISLVEVETTQSRVRIATAARTLVLGAAATRSVQDGEPAVCLDLDVVEGRTVIIRKLVAVVTSRDAAIASPRDGALAELAHAGDDFERLLRRHAAAWERLWERYAVTVETDADVQLILNLHVFHMLQTISPHTAVLDAGVPARGLHGEGYRGHVFWDELFVLPLYTMRTPLVARALLDYRWRRLDAAREAAARLGCRGARFPWQSGSDGREDTPSRLFNPRSGRWIADHSSRQAHVGLAVAYNVWQYIQSTGDLRWFAARGAELIVEVARFFADLAVEDASDGRFHIAGVMGPDEYHDGYPDAPAEGVRDNAYTNVLTAWVCHRAVDALKLLSPTERQELVQRTDLRADEPHRWADLGMRLAVPFHEGVISQFDGYERLAELDWELYRRTYDSIERLDLILEAEGDTPNRYRLSKQADVLMLLYLLGPTEVIHTLGRLGHVVTTEDLGRTVDYYLARTAHGSTLSRVVHTSVLTMLRREDAWSEFREALDADLDDVQGGTTGRGIHLGAMAGTVDIVLRAFTGMRLEADAVVFSPRPPGAMRRIGFEISYRGQRISVAMDQHELELAGGPGGSGPVHVVFDGRSALLLPGQSLTFPLRGGAIAATDQPPGSPSA